METTRLSSKGQIIIPLNIRKNIKEGTSFVVVQQNGLIILKEITGLTQQEIKEAQEFQKIWKDIDEGKCQSYSVEEFFTEMKKW